MSIFVTGASHKDDRNILTKKLHVQISKTALLGRPFARVMNADYKQSGSAGSGNVNKHRVTAVPAMGESSPVMGWAMGESSPVMGSAMGDSVAMDNSRVDGGMVTDGSVVGSRYLLCRCG